MNWIKKGLIFQPGEQYSWLVSHAQCPNPLELKDRLRIYFSSRRRQENDGMWVARGFFLDVAKEDPSQLLHIHDRPILELGAAGEFDHFGIMPGSVVPVGDKLYLYYCGWDRGVAVPYHWAIGLAVSKDGGETFQRCGKGPILGPTHREPYLQACPVVKREGGKWHMWYLSGLRWLEAGGRKESVYQLMHATSHDGIDWEREGEPIIPAQVEDECQTSAALMEAGDRHLMLFSYRYGSDFRNRRRGYRIGCAHSMDLRYWQRDDTLAGLEPSAAGWDSEMICYPSICTVGSKTYLFYCGNDFGRGGFGYAELAETGAD